MPRIPMKPAPGKFPLARWQNISKKIQYNAYRYIAHVHITSHRVQPLPTQPASLSSWGPPAVWSPTPVFPPAWPDASRHRASCLGFWSETSAGRGIGVHSQHITPLTVVVQDHMVILPKRRPMGHGKERDPKFGSIIHHHPLHVWRNQ
jgi:hypothetical protein